MSLPTLQKAIRAREPFNELVRELRRVTLAVAKHPRISRLPPEDRKLVEGLLLQTERLLNKVKDVK